MTRRFAHWFARDFALADDAGLDAADRPSVTAWTVFADAGGVLGTPVWNALAQGLHRYNGARPDHALRWVWVLMEQEHTGCWTDLLDYGFAWDEVWADPDLSLALWGHLTAPRLVPERGWGNARIRVATRGELHWLDTAWREKFKPNLVVSAPEVFPMVEATLLRHLNLEARVGRPGWGFTRHRSAIQPNAQDQYRDPIDAVIDAVRDTAVELWQMDPDLLGRSVERWLVSSHVLMRRLGVHVTGVSPRLDANGRVRFVLDRGLATVDGVAQEVFHLLGSAAPDADTDVVDQLVEAYAPVSEEESDYYTSFEALEWLERRGVKNAKLTEAVTELRRKLGEEAKGRPYPGMSSWMEAGWSGVGAPPMSAEEFDKRVRASPPDAVSYVLGFEDRTLPHSGTVSRSDAVTMMRDTVRQRPAAGIELWPHLADHPDLQGDVVAAWGHAVELADLEAIDGILVEANLATLQHDIGQFLGIRRQHRGRALGAGAGDRGVRPADVAGVRDRRAVRAGC